MRRERRMKAAKQTLWHDAQYRSKLVLPVIPIGRESG